MSSSFAPNLAVQSTWSSSVEARTLVRRLLITAAFASHSGLRKACTEPHPTFVTSIVETVLQRFGAAHDRDVRTFQLSHVDPIDFDDVAHVCRTLKTKSPWDFALAPSLLTQQLMPRQTRKSFASFYSPRWIVELAWERLAANRNLNDSTIVDPACGAGAFIAAACVLARCCPEKLADTVPRIRGFDIDPIAVFASRIACFGAIADLVVDDTVPSPTLEIANLFDPPTVSPSDVLVSNPPWIRFAELSPFTKKQTVDAASFYNLIPKSFHGGNQLDLSAVCTFRMLDTHLVHNGKAALVLPVSLLRSSSATAFRKLVLPDGSHLSIDGVIDFATTPVFADTSTRTALVWINKTRTPQKYFDAWIARCARKLTFDCSSPSARHALDLQPGLASFDGPARSLVFAPRYGETPTLDVTASLHGPTRHLRARKGITTDLNGAYFLRILSQPRPGLLRVVNDSVRQRKDIPSHTFDIEQQLVFPLLKGASQIHPFRIVTSNLAVIVPNQSIARSSIDPTSFARSFPLTNAHFDWIESRRPGLLDKRSTHRRMGCRPPRFRIYNVGNYTFAPYKVVWAEVSRSFCAAIASSVSILASVAATVIVPDHKVYFVPFEDLTDALFVCALLNSSPVREFVAGITHNLQIGCLLDRLRLPPFDRANHHHQQLVDCARSLTDQPTTSEDERVALLDEVAWRVLTGR